ncbi:hypothetical protein [Actinomadura livida]|uniref:Secreted protein n=1 Tax=Actinomadura livida TaxID=79909 RepID=A0A7W7I8I4_9ACTN|nr:MULTISPECIES: hypothetical protein [Actinomadura]MBB4772464.1 hypothetical protein [Actinomadura catellatispora]GGU22760.1 hypothetical protein GCM10010208_54670 [Actinomadura livida]
MRRRRCLAVLAAVGLALPLAAAIQSPAAADELSLSNFQLRPNSYGTDLRDRADALPLVKGTVTGIMNDLNRQDDDTPVTVNGACEPNAVQSGSSVALARSVCFNDGDNATAQWYPQGVTTVADMQADQEWGDGYKPVLVSWYDANANADGMVKGVRISFMNPSTGAYRHVLLVYPKANGDYDTVRVSQDSSSGSYNTSLHAGGILWYGDHLFVADTARGFRMFDMRRIFDLGASENGTTGGADKVGLHGGTYHGYGYRYVMPQVGSWTRTAATGTKCTTSDGSPQFSHVSLDRSGTDHLVSGEYCAGEEAVNGRVAAWPIAGAFTANSELITDPSYRWNADAAHKLPVSNVQGATRFNGRWYLSRSRGPATAGTFYTTAPATSSTTTLQVASEKQLSIGPEDLAHWQSGTDASNPGLGQFWTVGEHPGKRMVYAVRP